MYTRCDRYSDNHGAPTLQITIEKVLYVAPAELGPIHIMQFLHMTKVFRSKDFEVVRVILEGLDRLGGRNCTPHP